jgi:hypothetical protein
MAKHRSYSVEFKRQVKEGARQSWRDQPVQVRPR